MNKLPSRRWLLLIAASYFVCLLALAPASIFGVAVRHLSHGTVELINAQGTVWSGSGELVSADKGGAIGRYVWRFLASPLLSGQVQAALTATGQETATFSLNYKGLEVDHFQIKLPLEAFSGGFPAIGKFGIGGTVQLVAEHAVLSIRGLFGNISCDLRDIRTPIAKVNPVGSYRINLDGNGELVAVTAATIPGSALIVDGNGRFSLAQGLSFQGRISPAPEHRELLAPFLTAVGGNADSVSISF